MEYSMREFKKHTKRPSKIRAMNSAAKVAGKQNLELCRNQSQAPRVRMENGIPIHQEAMYQAFLNQDDQTGSEMDDKGFGSEKIGS